MEAHAIGKVFTCRCSYVQSPPKTVRVSDRFIEHPKKPIDNSGRMIIITEWSFAVEELTVVAVSVEALRKTIRG
jgi:hypothetical protein